MADPQVNFFKSTLVGTYSDTDTSLTVATGDGALLPDPSTDGAFNLTIFEGVQVTNSTSFEIVRVTARSGDVLTVTRGAESTTPLTIGSATHSILMSATKKTFDDIRSDIDNIDLTTISGAESITFDTTGDEEFGLPAGTTAQRPASPSAGYMRFNTDTKKLEVHTGGVWGLVSLENVRAMEVAQATVTANDAVFLPLEVEYLVIAGGGGGASNAGAGGGAGGYRSSVQGENSGGGASAESTFVPTLNTSYTVTVGAGGTGASIANGSRFDGADGSSSVFSTVSTTGGGGGSSRGSGTSTFDGRSGGSGGGAGANGSNGTGGSGTSGEGFAGGNAFSSASAGGGGAGGVGPNASGSSTSTVGGVGVASSITGSAVTRASGGSGGFNASSTVGGGGGAAENGDANTGGGGGGTGGGVGGGENGNGGSGVVILRYRSEYSITIGAGLTGTETTDGSEKYAVITAGTGNVSWT